MCILFIHLRVQPITLPERCFCNSVEPLEVLRSNFGPLQSFLRNCLSSKPHPSVACVHEQMAHNETQSG